MDVCTRAVQFNVLVYVNAVYQTLNIGGARFRNAEDLGRRGDIGGVAEGACQIIAAACLARRIGISPSKGL